RLLVCHDMANGYHSDAFPQGCGDDNAYYLTHWHVIDAFIYFSHHFVTIPCPTWINSAHRHGVQVLGTFITEWKEGAEKCRQLFASSDSAEQTAHQLAAIAAFFRFEGWLINIECDLEASLIPNLLHFLRLLTQLMRQQCPRSQVIWYDAVTTEGKLIWQNTLNDLNRPFLDATDAIFINYSWKAGTPLEAAAAAGERKQDVYMGIDVFGRGTFGGGQLNCNVAAAAARQQGLGVALFAPGWVYEGNTGDWRLLAEQLWSSLAAVLGPPRALIAELPFVTSFCPGLGPAVYRSVHSCSHDQSSIKITLSF
ncbi:glycoside hydrolase, partial [Coccomyxa subellipsoidea C-169]